MEMTLFDEKCIFQMHISLLKLPSAMSLARALCIIQRDICVPLSHIEVLTLLAYTIVYRTTVLIR